MPKRRFLPAAVLTAAITAAVIGLRPSLVGIGGVRYHGTQGERLVRFDLRSRLVGKTLRELAVIPPGSKRRPLLVLLHGRGSHPGQMLSDSFFRELHRLGGRAPVVLLPDGGDHSYWHDRADGRWGSYVVREAIPAATRRFRTNGRVAIGGISMGGFGALDLARLYPRRFCAVGGHSAALWLSAGETAPGAFDDPDDFARHDVIGAARRHPKLFGRIPDWIDGGDGDPFRSADQALAQALRTGVQYHVWPGGHNSKYWDAHMPSYLRFYSRALAACSTVSQ